MDCPLNLDAACPDCGHVLGSHLLTSYAPYNLSFNGSTCWKCRCSHDMRDDGCTCEVE